MPSKKELHHRRTHNLLLIQKLLGGRENASPFTLVLDSLEQSDQPLIREITKRANVSESFADFGRHRTTVRCGCYRKSLD
jgi:elongator complex protein 5